MLKERALFHNSLCQLACFDQRFRQQSCLSRVLKVCEPPRRETRKPPPPEYRRGNSSHDRRRLVLVLLLLALTVAAAAGRAGVAVAVRLSRLAAAAALAVRVAALPGVLGDGQVALAGAGGGLPDEPGVAVRVGVVALSEQVRLKDCLGL